MKALVRRHPTVGSSDPSKLPRHHPALLEAFDRLGPEESGEGLCRPEIRTAPLGWGYRIIGNGGEELEPVFPVRELLEKLNPLGSEIADSDPHLARAFASWKTDSTPDGTIEWSRVRKDLV
jgi:hypothetical protein